MTNIREQFLNRRLEIKGIYDHITIIQPQKLRDQINNFTKSLAETKEELTAESLMSGKDGKKEKRSKINDLNLELQDVYEKGEIINQKGGITFLSKTDQKLNQLGKELLVELEKQSIQDEKERNQIEKEYKELFSQLEKLSVKRRAFLEKSQETKRLAGYINKETENQVDLNKIYQRYELNKSAVFSRLDEEIKFYNSESGSILSNR